MLMAPLLSWDGDQSIREVEGYQRRVSVDRAAELARDDDEASRLAAEPTSHLPKP
jgi:hypothetical protein